MTPGPLRFLCNPLQANLPLGFLYPPIQVSTATIQGCLYPCDACTLRAVHILSHSPGCGNLQVLVWEISFSSLAAKPRIPSPQWWAGYANLPLRSAFHLALAKASGFTKVQARPCSTRRQGHSTMHRGHQGPIIALTGVSVGPLTYV